MKTLNRVQALGYTVCIGCGCHDMHACINPGTGEPCSWLAVDREVQLGVCSECPGQLARWQRGDRAVSDIAKSPRILPNDA